jgi:hypothetical protein
MTQIMNLLNLVPEIQEPLLFLPDVKSAAADGFPLAVSMYSALA